MSNWQGIGDGFSTAPGKLTKCARKISNRFSPSQRRASTFLKNKKNICELRSRYNASQGQCSVTNSEQRPPGKKIVGLTWKAEELKATFDLHPDTDKTNCSENEDNDNIIWSSSSSDDDGPPSQTQEEKTKHAKKVDGLRPGKRKLFRGCRKKTCNKSLSNCVNQSRTMGYTPIDATDVASSEAERNGLVDSNMLMDIVIKKEVLDPSQQYSSLQDQQQHGNFSERSGWERVFFNEHNQLLEKKDLSVKGTKLKRSSNRLESCLNLEDSPVKISIDDNSLSEKEDEESAEFGTPYFTTKNTSDSGTTNDQIDPSSPDCHSKMKASDWAKVIQGHETPSKNKSSDQTLTAVDSAKKKKKFSRGSFANQLHSLLQREKSSIRFWHHNIKTGSLITNDQQQQYCKVVCLVSLERQWSVYIARCRVMNGTFGTCKVVFLKDSVGNLKLRVGVTVSIYPPWHQLNDEAGNETILCTHYVSRLSETSTSERCETLTEKTVNATWGCPCSSDSCIQPHQCTASRLTQNVPPQVFRPSKDLHTHPARLTTSSRPNHELNPMTGSATVCQSLFASLAHALPGEGLLPPFLATVLRVFLYNNTESANVLQQLLLEDNAGTLALVTVDSEKDFKHLEGKTWSCGGLRAVGRITEDREPSLFHVIKGAWIPRYSEGTSQESQSSDVKKAPSICHSLEPGDGTMPAFDEIDASQFAEYLDVITCAEAIRQTELSSRVSVLASTVITGENEAFLLLPASQTCSKVTVTMRLAVRRQCILGAVVGHVGLCLIRDLSVDSDGLSCDQYSSLLWRRDWHSKAPRLDTAFVTKVCHRILALPTVSETSSDGDLVSVQGYISSVDESRSFSWETCDQCGSGDLLTSDLGSDLFCEKCQRLVKEPVARMNMEVDVQCSDMGHVRMQLCEQTIQNLLPENSDEEGHDVGSVVGRPLTSPLCQVIARTESIPQHGCCSGHSGLGQTALMEFDSSSLLKGQDSNSMHACIP